MVLARKESFLSPQAFWESQAAAPNQSVEEPRSKSKTPLFSMRWETYWQICDDCCGPKWPKFSPYSSSQKLSEDRERGGREAQRDSAS